MKRKVAMPLDTMTAKKTNAHAALPDAPASLSTHTPAPAPEPEPAPRRETVAEHETPAPRGPGRPAKHTDATGERVKPVAVSVRMPPDLYRRFATLAANEKVEARADGRPVRSMNDLILEAMEEWLTR